MFRSILSRKRNLLNYAALSVCAIAPNFAFAEENQSNSLVAKYLPVGHPEIEIKVTEEPRAIFNEKHYPRGVNGNFIGVSAHSCDVQFGGAKGLFENVESREIAKHADNILSVLAPYGIHKGAYVADIGAGTGLLTRRLSKLVGDTGKVYAQELSEGFIENLNIAKSNNNWSNVDVIQGSIKSSGIPMDNQCDVALLCDVYHHLEYPRTFCRSLSGVLKKNPKGYLIVIDFHRNDEVIHSHPKGWVMEHVRADQATFTKEIEEAGFVLVKELVVPGLTENYVLVFQAK